MMGRNRGLTTNLGRPPADGTKESSCVVESMRGPREDLGGAQQGG
jgi:hypothetical protein